MATAFAAQLSLIASKSTNELDLKAQKADYSQSLIFEKTIAGSQDIETVYQICLEGFRELCDLDARFLDFQRSLFSPQSKSQDRTRMTDVENAALDEVVTAFLQLAGGRLLLRPSIKAIEWLVRRFRIHSHNTSMLLSTFLPYHDTPIFRNLLSILPTQLPPEYRFLSPYLKTATNPPRHAIAYSATSSDAFFTIFNSYTIQTCQNEASHQTLLSFWSCIVVEAIAGRIGATQSGRKEVQRQRQEDMMIRLLPMLNHGLQIDDVPELALTCYAIIILLAGANVLAESVIDSMSEAVAGSMSPATLAPALVCLTVLASQKKVPNASKGLVKCLIKVPALDVHLQSIAETYPAEKLIQTLVGGSLASLHKKNFEDRISFVSVLLRCMLRMPDVSTIHGTIVDYAHWIMVLEGKDAVTVAIRSRCIAVLQTLQESERFSNIIATVLSSTDQDFSKLELAVGNVITELRQDAPAGSDSGMEIEEFNEAGDHLEDLLKHLPKRTADQHSFLNKHDSHLFRQLEVAFEDCCAYPTGLTAFEALPIWTSAEDKTLLLVTFLIRVGCGAGSTRARQSALRLIALHLSTRSHLDCQVLVPYIVYCFSAPAQGIRRAASELLMSILDTLPKPAETDGAYDRLGGDSLYDINHNSQPSGWLPPAQVAKLLGKIFVPVLEELILSPTEVSIVVRQAFAVDSTDISPAKRKSELKKGERVAFFELLVSHISATPLLRVKLELITILESVEKVGSLKKTASLMPLLHQWAKLSQTKATEAADTEKLPVSQIDRTMALIVSVRGLEELSQLLDAFTEDSIVPRQGLVEAVFQRISTLWKRFKPDDQVPLSARLFELAVSKSALIAQQAHSVLTGAELPSQAIVEILTLSRKGSAVLKDTPPPKKRRRTSHGQINKPLTSELGVFNERLSLALELVDDSKPEAHMEVLTELFETLAILQTLRRHEQSQLPYLLRLCLGSMLAIVKPHGSAAKSRLDVSQLRTDLITDCVRAVENTQVQNTALLLMAALVEAYPAHVLHHIMPIFAFMGSGVLKKEDEHSVFVINHTIDLVIPPLVAALRQKDSQDLIGQTADLILSIVAAFDHIPKTRRLDLFTRLINNLGPEDYLYAILGMLAKKYDGSVEIAAFIVQLFDSFSADCKMSAYRSLLDVVSEVLLDHTRRAEVIAAVSASSPTSERIAAARTLIKSATNLVKSKALRDQIANLGKLDAVHATSIRKLLEQQFTSILKLLRSTDQSLKADMDLCLEAFLSMPPLAEYFGALHSVLETVSRDSRPQVLRLLESRLRGDRSRAASTQAAAVGSLPLLAVIVSSTEDDVEFRVAAIACVDRISEQYGRKDLPAIVSIASTLAGPDVVGSQNSAVRAAALICLASILEVLKETAIPLVPDLIGKVLDLWEKSMAADKEDLSLHNACISLLLGVGTHVPFMISDDALNRILGLCAESAGTHLDTESHSNRRDLMHLLSKNLDLKQIVASSSTMWNTAVENDVEAVEEALDLIGNSIEVSAKAVVVRAVEQISTFFLLAADLRRIQITQRSEDSYSDEEVDRVEAKLKEVLMKFVYKLNDTVLRPVFGQWVEWAVECLDIQSAPLDRSKMLRQTTLFNVLAHFFITLKSIVTSYSTYLLTPCTAVLKHPLDLLEADPDTISSLTSPDSDFMTLYLCTLTLLTSSTTHDADSFFTSPTHFQPLASTLIQKLALAHLPAFQPHINTHLIPSIVSLATAVSDTPAHHITMNKSIFSSQLRHHPNPAVRLAVVQTQMALLDEETLGEEWCENVAREGDTLVAVNEMLEDDDELVEREVRRWVVRVREVLGEDVFES